MKRAISKSNNNFAFLIGICGISAVTWTGLGQTFNYLFIALILISISLMKIGDNQRINFKGVHLLAYSAVLSTIVTSLFLVNNKSFVDYLMEKNLSGTFLVSSYDSSNEFFILFKWILSLYSLPTFVYLVRRQSIEKYSKILYWWTCSVLLSAVIAILQSVGFLPKLPFIVQVGVDSGRFAGLSNHPNTQAILICLSMPIALILFRMNLMKRSNFVFLIGIFEYAIFLTGSRNGILCSVILLLLIFSRTYEPLFGSKLKVIQIYLFASGAVIFYSVGIIEFLIQNSRLSLNSAAFGRDESSMGHFALMRYGFDIFIHYPIFGIGPSVLKTFHNIYLQIAGSFGLIGIFAFTSYVRNLFRIDFTKNLKFEYRLIVFTFLLFGMFNNNLADFYLYLPLGLCYASASDKENIQV